MFHAIVPARMGADRPPKAMKLLLPLVCGRYTRHRAATRGSGGSRLSRVCWSLTAYNPHRHECLCHGFHEAMCRISEVSVSGRVTSTAPPVSDAVLPEL